MQIAGDFYSSSNANTAAAEAAARDLIAALVGAEPARASAQRDAG